MPQISLAGKWSNKADFIIQNEETGNFLLALGSLSHFLALNAEFSLTKPAEAFINSDT
jgi:hypothetical protein